MKLGARKQSGEKEREKERRLHESVQFPVIYSSVSNANAFTHRGPKRVRIHMRTHAELLKVDTATCACVNTHRRGSAMILFK